MEVQYEPLTLPELFQKAKKEAYQELDRQKTKEKTTRPENAHTNIPDCLSYILTAKPKTDNTNFNKLILNLVTGFQRTGYDYQVALDIALSFLTEYPHSTAYPTPKDRTEHFRTQWGYVEKNQNYDFSCSYILGLKFPGSAFDCKTCDWFEEEKQGEKEEKVEKIEPTKETELKSAEALLKYHLTDVGNAESFCELNGKNFIFIKEKKVWTTFDGVRWGEAREEIKRKMIETMRLKSQTAMKVFPPDSDQMKQIVKWCLGSESNFRLSAAMEIATLYTTKSHNDFDNDPWLFACKNGVIDLRTGSIRTATQQDMLQKSTDITHGPGAVCPRWIQFLDEIFKANKEMINFIQRCIGYTLTGLTVEQCLFLLYGTGANGKSVFLGVLEGLLGDYGQTTSFSTFKEKKYSDGIPNDIARIAGARMVKSVEIKEGTRLNEERIKALTGGDRMMARFLHNEFFEFDPIAKFWIAVNHKPVIRGTEEAIWRRIREIDFQEIFPEEKRDNNLLQKLKTELPGILNWAVQGCLLFQEKGLKPPVEVTEATEKYRQESDVINQFLQDKTEKGDDAEDKIKASDLYASYKTWSEENGEAPVTGTQFGRKMTEKGYEKKKIISHKYYLGVKFS